MIPVVSMVLMISMIPVVPLILMIPVIPLISVIHRFLSIPFPILFVRKPVYAR